MQWDYLEESWEPVRVNSRRARRKLFEQGREVIGGKYASRRDTRKPIEEREFGRRREH